jgi:beta-lactam-binding protein with PASTA domain
VDAGAWSAEVPLEKGANVVDVSASAEGRRPALAAVRIVRRVPIEVPDVEGEDPQAAVDELEALGLDTRVERGGGLLDDLLPATLGVCSTDPEPGTEVRVGTTVTLEVAKVC